MKVLKIFLRGIYFKVIKVYLRKAYNEKYLTGRFFDDSYVGWIWAKNCSYWQKRRKINYSVPWPVSPFITVGNYKNLEFHPDDLINFQGTGIYYQNYSAKIVIGRGTYIANNVGLITANHDPFNLDKHLPGKDIILGEKCWIGMNSVILPGTILGQNTIVGAGSVVTKSFPDGYCVIAGNPAKIIRSLI